MIVVDASAAVLGLLNAGSAREVLSHERIAVPHLIDSEVAHALRGQTRRSELDADHAATLLDRWARLGLRRHAVAALLPRVWALRDDLSAYDATYVALAEALGCALLTADARLARAPGVACPITVVPR